MSTMLSLTIHDWTQARTALRPEIARMHLERLVASRDLPCTELALANRLLADHLIRIGKYSAARYRLRAAIELNVNDASSYRLLAQAWEDDPYGCDRRAARMYREATKRDPNSAVAWASLARACVRCHRDQVALKAVRRAVRLAPAEPGILALVVETLREMGKLNRALKLLARARFLNPKAEAIPSLIRSVRYEIVRTGSRAVGVASRSRTILPFVRIVDAEGRRKTVRFDAPSGPGSIRMRRNSPG